MGTSISHRSPDTPRWRAVQAAYAQGLSDERVGVEILRASSGWEEALTSDAVAQYVVALESAYTTLADELRHPQTHPPNVVQGVVESTRYAALSGQGDISAVPVAERAFQHTLIETARGERSFLESSPAEAADAFSRNRGDSPAALVGRFVEHLISQYARHVIARDLAALVGHERIPDIRAASSYTDRVSHHLEIKTRSAYEEAPAGPDPTMRWRLALRSIFAASTPRAAPDD
jgi:hypothetical protein